MRKCSLAIFVAGEDSDSTCDGCGLEFVEGSRMVAGDIDVAVEHHPNGDCEPVQAALCFSCVRAAARLVSEASA